jgi:hypothetical protein
MNQIPEFKIPPLPLWKPNMFCCGCRNVQTCKSPCVIGFQDDEAKEAYLIEDIPRVKIINKMLKERRAYFKELRQNDGE